MAGHTPEPWITEQDDFGTCDEGDTDWGYGAGMLPVAIRGDDLTPIVRSDEASPFWNYDQPDGAVAHANANRIVAAVNACVGLTTQELTDGVVADFVCAASKALTVRRLQRAYFADRTSQNLIASKQAERELDVALGKVAAIITRQ